MGAAAGPGLTRPALPPRTVFPSWTGGTTRPAAPGRTGRGRAADAGVPLRDRPRLLLAGPESDSLRLLGRHLESLGAWEVARHSSPEAAIDGTTDPDLLVAAWTEETAVKRLVTALRQHVSGRELPVILLGRPSPGNGTSPTQPVRGVLCLPAPVRWRVLHLCLAEHHRAWRRRHHPAPEGGGTTVRG